MIRKHFRNLLTSVALGALLLTCAPSAAASGIEEAPACEICQEHHSVIKTTPDLNELRDLMNETYSAALKKSGLRNFHNRCSTLVNTTLQCLGIIDATISCHGKGEYDKFVGMDRTDTGYNVTRYGAGSYSLKGALNAISHNGTKDVYNIVLGFQSGSTYASRSYGHTCFIYAILDGRVYFIDNFDMTLGGTYYKAGSVVTCTINQFAKYYDKWAAFEGAVHFELPDTEAPQISEFAQVSDVSDTGFTLTYEVSDNVRITSVYAKVQAYSDTGEYRIIDGTLEDGIATVRVNTADFDGYQGYYYVTCYAGDGSNQPASATIEDGSVCLYFSEAQRCHYRVSAEITNVYSVPEATVNDQSTKIGMLTQNSIRLVVASYLNPNGELWLQLENSGWVLAADLTDDLVIPTQLPDFVTEILNWFMGTGIAGKA